jgi:hypothetical protein
MDERDAKAKFARLLLKEPSDPFVIALKVFPSDTKKALRVANEWPADPEVLSLQEKAEEEEGELAFLPTKGQLCRGIWEKMHDKYTDADTYAKLSKVYAEVRGFIEKPQIAVNTNVQNVTNKVMIVRENGSDAEWERKLLEQQARLANAQ